MDHVYQPNPKTGKCDVCALPDNGKGCLWCGHYRATHSGNVDPVVLKHFEIEAPGPIGGQPVKSSSVKWTPTACAASHCACRRYEAR